MRDVDYRGAQPLLQHAYFDKHLLAELASRFVIGSSMMRKSLDDVRARAIATLCCCPPESWEGMYFVTHHIDLFQRILHLRTYLFL